MEKKVSLGSINKDLKKKKTAPNPIAALLAVHLDDGHPSRPDEQISLGDVPGHLAPVAPGASSFLGAGRAREPFRSGSVTARDSREPSEEEEGGGGHMRTTR